MERVETAMRLDPFPPGFHLRFLGSAYIAVGRLEEAIAAFRKCVEAVPEFLNGQIGLTLAYMEAGQEEEAQVQARQVLRINPDFSSSSSPYVTSHKDPATRERYIELLRNAGLRE